VDHQQVGPEQAGGMQLVDRAGLVDVDAARGFQLARKPELQRQALRTDRFDAEADRRDANRIVIAIVDAPCVVEPGGRREVVRLEGHERIFEQMPDPGRLQRLERARRVVGRADVVAIVDDRRGAVGQHLEAADIGCIEIVLGSVVGAQGQQTRVVGAGPQVGHIAAQHGLPEAGVGIDDAGQRDHVRGRRSARRRAPAATGRSRQ
jgi:hypothetical protein